MGADAGRPIEFSLAVPPEHQSGVYANFLTTWHTAYEFTLDFAVTQPPEVPDEPEAAIRISCCVVARVKLPVTLLFDVIRGLNEEMTLYEREFGEIRPPGSADELDEP
jgi:hypothetical protein